MSQPCLLARRTGALFVCILLLGALSPSARAWDQWASEVLNYSSQFGTTSYSAAQAIDLPDVSKYGDNGNAWAPSSQNSASEYLTVGFPEQVFSDGVTIRETDGNGFVTKVDVVDTSGAYHTVWTGTDTSPKDVVAEFKVTWPQTDYLVEGVRIWINPSRDMDDWEEIDAVKLHGLALADFQWASTVLGVSSEYNAPPEAYSSIQALGEPNVIGYGDDPNAWTSQNQNGTSEYITLGFARPVYSDGVAIRETSGNGFVTKIETLDTSGAYHTVWTGTDPSQPGKPALFIATWQKTAYAVQGIRITVDTGHSTGWEEIDAAYIRGASAGTPAPAITSLSPATAFREGPAFTLTVNGTDFLNSSVVRWNGADRPTHYVSPTQLTADILAADIVTPGPVNVTVYNAPPGGGASAPSVFTVSQDYVQWASSVLAVTSEYGVPPTGYSSAQVLGAPNVTVYGDYPQAWTTDSKDIGLQSITLGYERAVYANGATIVETNAPGFVTKVEALDTAGQFHQVWAGADTSKPNEIGLFHVSFPQTAYAVHGLRITVDTNHTMDAWEEVDAVQLQGVPVTNAAPVLTKLSPNPALRAGPDFTLVLTGTGFAPNSVVKWNGADRATTFVSPTTLTITVTAAEIANSGAANIAVFTPAPGGGTSATIALTIGPARWGDVNGNGTTDMTDMLSALRIALGVNAAPGIATGDVAPEYPASTGGYGDGRITILDAVRILGFLRNP